MSTGPRHLVLVGLMGTGKTTVGRSCAATLARAFVDTDELVETALGMTVADVFARDGEGAFRAAERQAVADACASPVPLVIACGGGAVVDAENRRRLRSSGCVVWLRAPAATLAARVGADRGRPLLASGDPAATLERLAGAREAAYEAAAHVRVDTGDHDVATVTAAVLEEYARCTG